MKLFGLNPEAEIGYEIFLNCITIATMHKAIALTAFARKSDRDRFLEAGFQKHIAKPSTTN
ncbi:MAG: hypothetical protein RM347_001990 [Nostoc sp. ChiQUE02]|uniref:hypothetical protein n=1 Tax=Nostoc sp. ChiQUE02 TaxID=3075377 RepID=UPI002AD218DE|nr:hypothetical protein [Nostoc sp. ChiQUE02]MDZ8235508.1 hypothetical protein [Nostoc sp. ChiQUE02]